MVKIINLIEIKRKPNIKEVTADNGKYILSIDSILIYNIKPEMSFNDEEWERIIIESDTRIGIEIALESLSRGMRTEREIKDKLKEKNIGYSAVQGVLGRLRELNYIDDFKYAKDYIESFSESKGSYRLRNELFNKGVDKAIIDEALLSIGDEIGFAVEVANKYTKGIAPKQQNDREKLIRHLLSRGYSYEVIKAAIKRLGGITDDLSDI